MEKIPNGVDLMETLIKLLADQEGVEIRCELVVEYEKR